MGKKQNATFAGWASAHIATLIEDGIWARGESTGREVPASVVFITPHDAEFVMKIHGLTPSEDQYVRICVIPCDSEGYDL